MRPVISVAPGGTEGLPGSGSVVGLVVGMVLVVGLVGSAGSV